MKIFFLVVSTFIWLILLSCKNSDNQGISVGILDNPKVLKTFIIDFAKAKNPQTVKLSLLVKDIQYIPLETKRNCLIKSAFPKFTSDNIFVASGWKIYRFDNTGKFLNTIGMLGKGPGEYIVKYGFAINDSVRHIFIRARENKVVEYNYQGKHIGSFNIPGPGLPGLVFRSPNQLHFPMPETPPQNGNRSPAVIVSDLKGNLINQFPNPTKRENFRGFSVPIIFCSKNEVMFMPNYSDTLYTVSDSLLIPKACFNLGSLKFDFDKFNISDGLCGPDKYFIFNLMEFPGYYLADLANMGEKKNSQEYLINKETKEIICIKHSADNFLFENDLDGGPEPKNLTIENDSLLVGYLQAIDLIDWVKRKKHLENHDIIGKDKRQHLVELVARLTENDNPIVVKYVLK